MAVARRKALQHGGVTLHEAVQTKKLYLPAKKGRRTNFRPSGQKEQGFWTYPIE